MQEIYIAMATKTLKINGDLEVKGGHTTSGTNTLEVSDGTAKLNKQGTTATDNEILVRKDLNDLDVSFSNELSAAKTITQLSQTDGKISATASNIQISTSQVTGLDSTINTINGRLDSLGFKKGYIYTPKKITHHIQGFGGWGITTYTKFTDFQKLGEIAKLGKIIYIRLDNVVGIDADLYNKSSTDISINREGINDEHFWIDLSTFKNIEPIIFISDKEITQNSEYNDTTLSTIISSTWNELKPNEDLSFLVVERTNSEDAIKKFKIKKDLSNNIYIPYWSDVRVWQAGSWHDITLVNTISIPSSTVEIECLLKTDGVIRTNLNLSDTNILKTLGQLFYALDSSFEI